MRPSRSSVVIPGRCGLFSRGIPQRCALRSSAHLEVRPIHHRLPERVERMCSSECWPTTCSGTCGGSGPAPVPGRRSGGRARRTAIRGGTIPALSHCGDKGLDQAYRRRLPRPQSRDAPQGPGDHHARSVALRPGHLRPGDLTDPAAAASLRAATRLLASLAVPRTLKAGFKTKPLRHN